MSSAISVENLTKQFRSGRIPIVHKRRVEAVKDVSLDIPEGSIFGLVGPNGAGKTTLMRLILGLLQPTEGDVEILGERYSVFGTPALSKVGALIEEPRFFPYLSGKANLKQIATLLGNDAHETIDTALHNVGLGKRGKDKVKTYSLGMRQRLGLARCFLGSPSLLVLDEPTNGMDPQGIDDTRDLLRHYVTDHGATIFLSSHLLDGVEQLCDNVAFMYEGRILKSGTVKELSPPGSSWKLHVSKPKHALDTITKLATDSNWKILSSEMDEGSIEVAIEGTHDSAMLVRALVDADINVSQVRPVEHTLKDLYQQIIGPEVAVRWSE